MIILKAIPFNRQTFDAPLRVCKNHLTFHLNCTGRTINSITTHISQQQWCPTALLQHSKDFMTFLWIQRSKEDFDGSSRGVKIWRNGHRKCKEENKYRQSMWCWHRTRHCKCMPSKSTATLLFKFSRDSTSQKCLSLITLYRRAIAHPSRTVI